MTRIRHTRILSRLTGHGSLTVMLPARAPKVITDSHVNYPLIEREIAKGDDASVEEIIRLLDVAGSIEQRLRAVSRKVGYRHGQVTYRGKPVDQALSDHVMRMLREDDDNYVGFVRALENIAHNPSATSRQHLFTWMRNGDLTFDTQGRIIGYKGVLPTGDCLSLHSGTAYVDGVQHVGQIPNRPGTVISMPRAEVTADRDIACSYGLHVGTYEYALNYGSRLLLVAVDPRDVVSVPRDAQFQKMRCCRYTVLAIMPERQRVAAPTWRAARDTGSEQWDDDTATVAWCPSCGTTACGGTCERAYDTGYDRDDEDVVMRLDEPHEPISEPEPETRPTAEPEGL